MKTASEPTGLAFQPHIEGLRAVAVLAVVAHHVGWLPNGFLGVDVFFVISGFLITSLLKSDLIEHGQVRLLHFYARRARRILPMAGLVIVVSLALALGLSSPNLHKSFATEGGWAAAFAANIHYLQLQTDYFAEGQPLLLRHYWSLAVEEQFYLVWPILLLLVAAIAKQKSLRFAIAVASLATAGSFAAAVVVGTQNPTAAYFSTATRAWELGLGAVLALVWRPGLGQLGKGKTALVALVLLAVSFIIPLNSYVPAWQAVFSVLFTGAVIWFGMNQRVPLLDSKVMLRIGQRSYGWYLWHWPLIVLLQINAPNAGPVQLLVAAAAAYALAELTFKFFEQPIRTHVKLRSDPNRAIATGVSSLAVALGVSGLIICSFSAQAAPADSLSPRPSVSTSATPTSASPTPTSSTSSPSATPTDSPSGSASPSASGPKVQELAPTLTGTDYKTLLAQVQRVIQGAIEADLFPANFLPRLGDITRDNNEWFDNGCGVDFAATSVPECVAGDTEAERTMVIYGDSHAIMWMPALDRIGQAEGWKVVLFAKLACPTVEEAVWSYQLNRPFFECQEWQAQVLPQIRDINPELLLVTDQWKPAVKDGRKDDAGVEALWKRAYPAAIQKLAGYTDRLVVLGNVPNMTMDAATCIGERDSIPWFCTGLRDESEYAAINRIERNAAKSIGATYVDVMSWACTAQFCPTMIGGRVAYFDRWHFTNTYVTWLQPLLQAAIGLND